MTEPRHPQWNEGFHAGLAAEYRVVRQAWEATQLSTPPRYNIPGVSDELARGVVVHFLRPLMAEMRALRDFKAHPPQPVDSDSAEE